MSAFYNNHLEYLEEHFKLLKFMLLKQVIQMRALEEKDNMSKYRGYVITFKEIEQIFDDAPNLDDEDEQLIEEIDHEINMLKRTIGQK